MIYKKKVTPRFWSLYQATKRGYWDIKKWFQAATSNSSFEETMTPYDGLDMTMTYGTEANEVTCLQKVLPNFDVLWWQKDLLARRGVTYLVPSGNDRNAIRTDGVLDNCDDVATAKTYNVFVKDGKPVFSSAENFTGGLFTGQYTVPVHTVKTLNRAKFTSDSAVITGSSLNAMQFTAGDIASDYTFPNQSVSSFDFDIITRITSGTKITGRQLIFKIGVIWAGINRSKFLLCKNAVEVVGQPITANTTYWYRFTVSGSTDPVYKALYLIDDGTYTFDTLPDISQWTVAAEEQWSVFVADRKSIQVNYGNAPWLGTFDFSNFRAYIRYHNAQTWQEVWRPIEQENQS